MKKVIAIALTALMIACLPINAFAGTISLPQNDLAASKSTLLSAISATGQSTASLEACTDDEIAALLAALDLNKSDTEIVSDLINMLNAYELMRTSGVSLYAADGSQDGQGIFNGNSVVSLDPKNPGPGVTFDYDKDRAAYVSNISIETNGGSATVVIPDFALGLDRTTTSSPVTGFAP